MGTWSGHKAKFVRRFADLKNVRDNGVKNYNEAVRNCSFPDPEAESYSMDPSEWVKFLESQAYSE
jgi:3-methyl-2-oxobutanoate hydroxymethyltransferase